MAHRAWGCIGPGKEDQIAGPCLLTGYNGALIINPFRRCPGQIVDAGVCIDPADVSAAVEGGCRGGTASHIGVTDILRGFRKQRPEDPVPHGFPRLEAARPHPAIDCRGVDPLGVGPVLHGQGSSQKAFQVAADLLLVCQEDGHGVSFFALSSASSVFARNIPPPDDVIILFPLNEIIP